MDDARQHHCCAISCDAPAEYKIFTVRSGGGVAGPEFIRDIPQMGHVVDRSEHTEPWSGWPRDDHGVVRRLP